MGPGTGASDGLPGPQRPQAAVDAGRGSNQDPEARTLAGRTATSLAASLLGWASVGEAGAAPFRRPGSAVLGERPRGRGLGRCGAFSSLRGQPGPGEAALRQRREPHGATQQGLRVGGHRGSSVVREAYSPHWGKMSQLTNVSPQPTRLRGNLRAHGGGAERAGGSPRACSVQRAVSGEPGMRSELRVGWQPGGGWRERADVFIRFSGWAVKAHA